MKTIQAIGKAQGIKRWSQGFSIRRSIEPIIVDHRRALSMASVLVSISSYLVPEPVVIRRRVPF